MTEVQRLRDENQKLKRLNISLMRQNEEIIISKILFVQQTSQEIEKLRAFIRLLSNALLGYGYSSKDIRKIENRTQVQFDRKKYKHTGDDSIPEHSPSDGEYSDEEEEKESTASPLPSNNRSIKDRMKQFENNDKKTYNNNKNNNSYKNKSKKRPSIEEKHDDSSSEDEPPTMDRQKSNLSRPIFAETPIRSPPNRKPIPKNISLSKLPETRANIEEPTEPISLKDRMAKLQGNYEATDKKQEDRIKKLKEERNLNKVKVSQNKDKIGNLFNKRIEKSKEMTAVSTKNGKDGTKLKDVMKNPTPEKAKEVMINMNFFTQMKKTPQRGKKKAKNNENKENEEEEAPKLEVMNMNNQPVMKKMSDKEREQFKETICQGIVSNTDLKQIQMCNADVDDDFFIKILDTLESNPDNTNQITELWFENNTITDKGMERLAEFIINNQSVTVIKLFQNKKSISTPVLKKLVDALEKNTSIVKFVFDGFRFQQDKDRRDKYLRRNADIARKKRNEARKKQQQQG